MFDLSYWEGEFMDVVKEDKKRDGMKDEDARDSVVMEAADPLQRLMKNIRKPSRVIPAQFPKRTVLTVFKAQPARLG